MQRPDIDKYEAMTAAATEGPWEVYGSGGWNRQVVNAVCVICRGPGGYEGDSDLTEPDAALIAASRMGFAELCAYIRDLETLIRDWLDACPETCGQCEHVHKRAEEAAK